MCLHARAFNRALHFPRLQKVQCQYKRLLDPLMRSCWHSMLPVDSSCGPSHSPAARLCVHDKCMYAARMRFEDLAGFLHAHGRPAFLKRLTLGHVVSVLEARLRARLALGSEAPLTLGFCLDEVQLLHTDACARHRPELLGSIICALERFARGECSMLILMLVAETQMQGCTQRASTCLRAGKPARGVLPDCPYPFLARYAQLKHN